VRVYVLKAVNVADHSSTGKSNPRVRMRMGGKTKWVKSATQYDTSQPHFFERFDLSCKIPGEARLEVQILDDNDGIDRITKGNYDLIGSTSIALDDRVFSREWVGHGTRKPIERRRMMLPTSSHSQAGLYMWVDAVPKSQVRFPVWDITKPPDEDFEVRIVVWKVEGIPAGDEFTDQSDLFVKLKLGNEAWSKTDTHLLAKKGKGSFNYRFKDPVTLEDGGIIREEGASKLKIQVWDADLFVNDILCQKQINLAEAFRNAWTCKDSGLPYHHMGNVAAQLEAAALVAQRNRELDGEDGGDGGSDECPINWRGNKQGFAEFEAEYLRDNAWRATVEEEGGGVAGQTRESTMLGGSDIESGMGGVGEESPLLSNSLELNINAVDTGPGAVGLGEAMPLSLLSNSFALNDSSANAGPGAEDLGEEMPLLSDNTELNSPVDDIETGRGIYGSTDVNASASVSLAGTDKGTEKKTVDLWKKAGDAKRHKKKKLPSFVKQFKVIKQLKEIRGLVNKTETGKGTEQKTGDHQEKAGDATRRTQKKPPSFAEQLKDNLGLVQPENSRWVSFERTDLRTGEIVNSGARILLSIEILPKSLAAKRKNSEGRDEPNAFPTLPPPDGRVDFLKMMYNPLYAIKALLGDTLATQCGTGCFCCLGVIAFLFVGVILGPQIQLFETFLDIIPDFLEVPIVVVAFLVIAAGIVFCCLSLRSPNEDDSEDDPYDDSHNDLEDGTFDD